MEQFTLTVKFTANTENKEKFKQELLNLFETINKEENFISAILHQNIQKQEEFLVYETWNDNIEHFMNVQLKKPYALEWEKLLDKMDIQREPAVYTPFGKFGSEQKKL